jgi:hypothetical protein
MHVAGEEERRGVRDRDAPEIRDHARPYQSSSPFGSKRSWMPSAAAPSRT